MTRKYISIPLAFTLKAEIISFTCLSLKCAITPVHRLQVIPGLYQNSHIALDFSDFIFSCFRGSECIPVKAAASSTCTSKRYMITESQSFQPSIFQCFYRIYIITDQCFSCCGNLKGVLSLRKVFPYTIGSFRVAFFPKHYGNIISFFI